MLFSADKESQTRFLICCIRNAEGGKLVQVNWERVAAEMGVVSKGAAAKRYERLLKQYSEIAPGETSSSGAAAEDNDGIGSDGADNNAGEPSSAVSSSPAATGKGKARVAPTTPRKRKTSVKAAAASSLSPAGPAAEDEDAEASDSQPMSASKRARGAAAGAAKSGRKALPNSPRTPCKTRENAAVASTELGVKNEANEGGNRVQVTEEPQEPVVKQENGDEEATAVTCQL